ncbi:MAG: hypothetical protein WBO19_15650 [Terriglobia bacterium]
MKRTIFGLATVLVVFLTVLAVLVVHPLRTVKAHHGCSDRTLMGDYGWTEFGSDKEDTPTPTYFWTVTALVHFDGNGHFSASDVWEVDDGVSSGPLTGAGTYTVNSNCTMTITYTTGDVTWSDNGVIVDANGGEIIASEYGPAPPSEDATTGHVDIKKIGDSD